MKKQKIAVFLSSLMMLSILVPAIVSAQVASEGQEGTVKIEGSSDLFYEGYNPNGLSSPEPLAFTQTTASSVSQTVRVSDEDTSSPADVEYGYWHKEQFIGVLHFNDQETFTITAQSSGKFEDGAKEFTAISLGVVTGTGLEEDDELTTIECAKNPENNDNPYCHYNFKKIANEDIDDDPMTESPKTINQIYYYEPLNSGYTYKHSDFIAPKNVAPSYDPDNTTYTSIMAESGEILLESTNGVSGLFGVGFDYKLEIPGNVSQGTYSTTITYDLTTDDVPQP